MTESIRWNVTLTRELVGQRYGAEQVARIRPVLRAVNVRLHHAAMHYEALKMVTARNLDEPIDKGATAFDLMCAEDDEPGATNLFFITCEMHLFGAIQALHAVADNMAHVVYYAVGWNLEGWPPKARVSFHKVLEQLGKLPDGRLQKLESIFNCMNELKRAPSFLLLEDASNHIKHHGGLHATVSWEPSPDRPYELRLSEFERPDVMYPQQDAVELLEQTHLVMSKAVVGTGCAVNEWLKNSAQPLAIPTKQPR